MEDYIAFNKCTSNMEYKCHIMPQHSKYDLPQKSSSLLISVCVLEGNNLNVLSMIR